MYNHYATDSQIQEKVKNRWNFIYTESIGLSYMLTPKYASSDGFYIDEDKMNIISSIEKFVAVRNQEMAGAATAELITFLTKMSTLSENERKIYHNMSSKQYFSIFGYKNFPALNICASVLSNMICSSASSERAWSIYRFVHTRLRNRLSNEKVEKLVFLYINSALLDETDQIDYVIEDSLIQNEEYNNFNNFNNSF